MATEPQRNKVKRLAVLLEMEDGSMEAVYAEPDPAHNDVTVEFSADRAVERVDWSRPGDGAGRTRVGPLDASIHVDGLHAWEHLTYMPSTIRAALDVIQSAVKL